MYCRNFMEVCQDAVSGSQRARMRTLQVAEVSVCHVLGAGQSSGSSILTDISKLSCCCTQSTALFASLGARQHRQDQRLPALLPPGRIVAKRGLGLCVPSEWAAGYRLRGQTGLIPDRLCHTAGPQPPQTALCAFLVRSRARTDELSSPGGAAARTGTDAPLLSYCWCPRFETRRACTGRLSVAEGV